MEWTWIGVELALALHERQLAEHGGPAGIRDMGMLESALARPVNRALYEEPDAADLAASYAYGIARNHAFIDGNKRTAWVLARLFLKANGVEIAFDKADAINVVLGLAAGDVSEDQLARWFRHKRTA